MVSTRSTETQSIATSKQKVYPVALKGRSPPPTTPSGTAVLIVTRNVERDYGYQCYSVRCTKRRLQLEKENKKLGSRVQYLQRKVRDLENKLEQALERGPQEKRTERVRMMSTSLPSCRES